MHYAFAGPENHTTPQVPVGDQFSINTIFPSNRNHTTAKQTALSSLLVMRLKEIIPGKNCSCCTQLQATSATHLHEKHSQPERNLTEGETREKESIEGGNKSPESGQQTPWADGKNPDRPQTSEASETNHPENGMGMGGWGEDIYRPALSTNKKPF